MSNAKDTRLDWNDWSSWAALLLIIGLPLFTVYSCGRPWTCEEAEAIRDKLELQRDGWVNKGDTNSLYLTWDEKQKNDKNVERLCKKDKK